MPRDKPPNTLLSTTNGMPRVRENLNGNGHQNGVAKEGVFARAKRKLSAPTKKRVGVLF